MTMVGADTAELAELAAEFGDAADELDQLARRLAQSIDRPTPGKAPAPTAARTSGPASPRPR